MPRTALVALLSLLLLLLLLASSTAANDLSTGSPEEARGEAWVGIWLLDRDASDSVEPMLEAMRAPWIARKAAAVMTPTMTITALDHGGLRVINDNPIRRTDEEIFVDGVPREKRDALDRKVVRSASWSATGELVVRNLNHVERNEFVEVTSTWSVAGDTLEISNAIRAEDGPMVIRRVFRKQ